MKFEYKLEKNLNEYDLNRLGEKGWELVCSSDMVMLYFKRELCKE